MFDSKNEEIYDEELINILFLENEEEYNKKIKEISENMTLYTAEDENHKKLYKIFKYAEESFYDVEKRKNFSDEEIKIKKTFFVNRMRIIQRTYVLKGRSEPEILNEMLETLTDYNIFLNTLHEKQFKKYKNQAEEKFDKIEIHDKKTMETMGIFLSIFSLIGLGISSVLNLETNHISIWLMMCGTILVTMTGLFSLINNKFGRMKILIIVEGLVLLGIGGFVRYHYPENKTKLELLEKDVENLSKNLNAKYLNEEIKKLQSEIKELEKNKN